ncbi:MAG TPA: 2-oxo-tetronate isomerase [Xanthobacteraceae bacterium]|nr:2-oxo-tetronate isomerase [Xanthobacteraceae bacterium]
MPRLAANLSWLFTELPFLDRFEAAAAAGFRAVEFLQPYEFPPEEIAVRLERHRLEAVLFNLPPGDTAKGERGLAALPGREAEFMRNVARAIDYATATGCRRIHALAGNAAGAEAETIYVANLRAAADLVAPFGITLLIEPLNVRDAPGYLVSTSGAALRLIDRIDRASVKLQFDLYHCQIMEGDLARHIRELAGRFAHVQIAGVPGRNEPDVGEVNYPYLLELLDESGYAGWVGCEYRPKAGTLAGLGWARRWGVVPAR